jgi:hypothetical protein
MPSSWTDLGFELQAAGEDLNTWGDPKLNNSLKRINYAIGGYQPIALTGDYTLTSSNTSTTQSDFQARNSLLKFTGTLSVAATITVPSTPMRWSIWNATNKTLTITTGAGNTALVEAGDCIPVECDGMAMRTISFGGYNLKDYITAFTASAGAVPSPIGNAGKYLYSDG